MTNQKTKQQKSLSSFSNVSSFSFFSFFFFPHKKNKKCGKKTSPSLGGFWSFCFDNEEEKRIAHQTTRTRRTTISLVEKELEGVRSFVRSFVRSIVDARNVSRRKVENLLSILSLPQLKRPKKNHRNEHRGKDDDDSDDERRDQHKKQREYYSKHR